MLLLGEDGSPLLIEPAGDTATWAGKSFKVKVRSAVPSPITSLKRIPGEWYEWPIQRPEHPPEYVQPSAITQTGKVGEATEIGHRFSLSGRPDMDLIGNALHGFLAGDRVGLTDAQRKDMAGGLLARWNVALSLDVAAVLAVGDALRTWADRNWPGARWHREWPLRMSLKTGSTLRGIADLVLETKAGYILIDHKSFPGGRDKALEKAASYAGQILAYAEAIRVATGKPVLKGFIHLPLLGLVVPVER